MAQWALMVKENLLEKNLYSVAQLLEVNDHLLYVKYLLDGKKLYPNLQELAKKPLLKSHPGPPL